MLSPSEPQVELGTRKTSGLKFPWRIFTRWFFIQYFVIVVALGLSGLVARHFFKKQSVEQTEQQLRGTLVALSHQLKSDVALGWCNEVARGTQYRLTVIETGGKVLCDSQHEPLSMENHANRPEVAEARDKGFSSIYRMSSTLKAEFFYAALYLEDRKLVLRAAVPLPQLKAALGMFDRALVFFLVFVTSVLSLTALWTGRLLVRPMSQVLYQAKGILTQTKRPADALTEEAFGEWSELESSLEQIQQSFESKVDALTQEREQLSTLMGALSDAILAIDKDGRPLFRNQKVAALLGPNALDQKTRLWEMSRDPQVLSAFKTALMGQSNQPEEAVTFLLNGETKYFSFSVAPLKRGQGQVYGAVGVFHDITELKRAEQIRIEFVANVSHELRTPLTAIKGFSDTILGDHQAGRKIEAQHLEAVSRNSERLVSLIEELLDLSNLESSEVLKIRPFDPAETTQRVVSQLQATISSKGQTLNWKSEVKQVRADSSRVEQVLSNLIDNARKYTDREGKITVLWSQDPKGGVRLTVQDTGPGIAPEHHARLFERFYRVDKARSHELGGTGLGLAIVKHIMQRHGGTVWVESKLGEGARFICLFP